MHTEKRTSKFLKNPRTLLIGTMAIALLAATTGFCDAEADVMKEVTKVQGVLFGPVVRKIALVLGLGGGVFQAFMSGSVRPLIIYGGLGLIVNFLPSMINWITDLAPVPAAIMLGM